MSDRRYLNLEESASYLRMSPGEFRQFVNDGRVPFMEIGSGQVFERIDLQRFMRSLKQRKPIPPGTVQKEIDLTRKAQTEGLTEAEQEELQRLREILRR